MLNYAVIKERVHLVSTSMAIFTKGHKTLWATVNGGNGKWKRKVETESGNGNGNGKRKRERVVTAIRTMS